MDVTVITPVGPGHDEIAQQALQSVMLAANEGLGPFDNIHVLLGDDTLGDKGRSATRNICVFYQEPWQIIFSSGEDKESPFKSDWLFFLDSDDVMCSSQTYGTSPFITAGKYIESYDAIWGTIHELHPSGQIFRRKQPDTMTKYSMLIKTPPALSLQMGHFVRRSVFEQLGGFNEDLNVGEDFEYYLRIWRAYRCIKQAEPLFLNRRGAHSWNDKQEAAPSGRPLPTGRDWTNSVEAQLRAARDEYDGSKSLDAKARQ